MAQLPEEFIQETRLVMGEERFNSYMEAFNEEAPTSIRLNPKYNFGAMSQHAVPWCEEGFYLEQSALDLCAAPGGKSTALRSVLPPDCVLISNEPMGTRAQILLENVTKWGGTNHIVTNNYPRDFRRAKLKFDVILCDVPCSGEGMFRRDPNTISEWSPQNVEKCWRLQREIVADAWECLNPGGLLIYSTCTFNTKENEENVRWIIDTYDAEILEIPIKPEWHITGSLLEGFDAPVYRFIPGITQSEGLFMAVFRKGGINVGAGTKNDMQRLKVLKADLPEGDFPQVDLPYFEALKYLRGEALVLPADTPLGSSPSPTKAFHSDPSRTSAIAPTTSIRNLGASKPLIYHQKK